MAEQADLSWQDAENPEETTPLWEERSKLRERFLTKMYGTVVSMLFISLLVVDLFYLCPNAAVNTLAMWEEPIVVLVGLLMFAGFMLRYEACGCLVLSWHAFPANWLYLVMNAILVGIVLACISFWHTANCLLVSACFTGVLFFVLSQSRGFVPALLAESEGMQNLLLYMRNTSFILLSMAYADELTMTHFPWSQWWHSRIVSDVPIHVTGAMFFCGAIAFDTRVHLHRGSDFESPGEVTGILDTYAVGAHALYLDIVNLFFFLLPVVRALA